MKKVNDIIYKKMEELKLEEELKEEISEELNCFKKQFTRLISLKNNLNINIVLDRMPQRKINALLEIIPEVIKKYKVDYEIREYKDYRRSIKNCIIVVDDFDEFCNDYFSWWSSRSKIKEFFKNIRKNNNIIIFTYAGNIEKQFEDNNVDKYIFDVNTCIRIGEDNSDKKEYELFLKKIESLGINNKLSYSDFEKILEDFKDNEFVLSCSISDYLYEYTAKKTLLTNTNKVDFETFKDIVEEKKSKPKTDLKNLIGLKNIKSEIDSLCNYAKFINELKIDKEQTFLNMFFLGNPGTGKTTVARLIAEKLYNLGFLKENDIVEITPNDLTGEYIGQTKEKTQRILRNAKGKLLFIDEAYLLYNNSYSKGNNPYMEEAIVELLKYIEDPKNIVIFAGYTNEMKKIYEANPGIKSRIYKEINFPDYTITELYKILNNDLINKGLIIDKKSKQNIINYIKQLKNNKDFGNARNMKQLSQQLLINHSNRKIKNKIIDKEDLPILNNSKTRIGFGEYYG